MNWIDITIPLYDGMLRWPGDPAVEIRQVMRIENGDPCNVTRLNMSAHTGTHMDAPSHFVHDGRTMSAWTPRDTVGPCRVIAIDDPVAIRSSELEAAGLQPGEIILFKTDNSERRYTGEQFHEDFVYIAQDAAQLLVERKVRAVGIDYLSVGGFRNDLIETHLILLNAGIWIIEGINLRDASSGAYHLTCVPIKLEHADGAPARAFLTPITA